MIKKIKLKNWQGFKEGIVEFAEGFNVIIGKTDSGKSSIFKAFEWVRTNNPKHTRYIHNGKDNVSVSIFSDKGKVTRSRSRKETGSYKVNGEIFTTFGSSIPQEVTDVFNMSDINIQLQLDKHFFLFNTGGQSAVELNSITKMDSMNGALKSLRIQKADLVKEYNEKYIKRKKMRAFLKGDFKKELESIKKLNKAYIVRQQNLAKLAEEYRLIQVLIDSAIKTQEYNSSLKLWKETKKDYSELKSVRMSFHGISIKYYNVIRRLDELDRFEQRMEELTSEINKYEKEKSRQLNRLKECPYCGSLLNGITRGRLLDDG